MVHLFLYNGVVSGLTALAFWLVSPELAVALTFALLILTMIAGEALLNYALQRFDIDIELPETPHLHLSLGFGALVVCWFLGGQYAAACIMAVLVLLVAFAYVMAEHEYADALESIVSGLLVIPVLGFVVGVVLCIISMWLDRQERRKKEYPDKREDAMHDGRT